MPRRKKKQPTTVSGACTAFPGQLSPSWAKNWRSKRPLPTPLPCPPFVTWSVWVTNAKLDLDIKARWPRPFRIVFHLRPGTGKTRIISHLLGYCDGSQRSHINLWSLSKGTASISSSVKWGVLTWPSVKVHSACQASVKVQIFHDERTCPLLRWMQKEKSHYIVGPTFWYKKLCWD